MELIFNELSISPPLANKHEANDRMVLFVQAVNEAKKYNFRGVRADIDTIMISLTENYSLHDWLFDNDFSKEHRGVLYGMWRRPFIEYDNDGANQRYAAADYFFEDKENDISKQSCPGLAAAYLTEKLAISIDSGLAWRRNKLNITIEEQGTPTRSGEVSHVYSTMCFAQKSILDFIETISELELIKTEVAPKDKNSHFTNHHGKKELKALWEKLRLSPYVVSAMSIEWGRTGDHFYKNPQPDGKVDIVDLRSTRRYAMQLQTTGRNLRETKAIAKILGDEYS